ncbi:Holliday junction resolvase RuvX [Candidatus Curculioniphilus buchneri]|uniref:Holliday junction resolvase RuvX n=1 Tax=Candidatus Curculioniphilus buchneri TaxID=690594 RepID=UPI00376EE098
MKYSDIIMACDFGLKSIGVAIGQHITCTAQPLTIFKARNGMPNWIYVKKTINEWQPKIIIVGLPLNMNGSQQFLTIRARNFANQIHTQFRIQTILYDERLSTVEARSKLFEQGGYRALKKSQVDATSAAIILESWLR